MKVSLQTIKQYVPVELPPVDELVARINAQLGGVEEVIDLGAQYESAKIVRIVECEKHPDADKLSVCQVDAGTGELVQVVCGAPNARADMWAVWLPPESTVPATFFDAEPFVLGARKLRGVMSQGMLAAADEMAIGDGHEGVIELTEADLPAGVALQPGASFAETFGLNDTVIEIENKMFTHRPDCFGQLGVAREISAILQGVTAPGVSPQDEDTSYENPQWYSNAPRFEQPEHSLALAAANEAEQKVPRIMFSAMQNVTIGPSPMWLQCALVAMGAKPINNVVDSTNYLMLLTAQPTHAYDYDKLRGQTISARMATPGEHIKLLNGKTYELSEEDIVIADGERAIGLGGIMGGSESEVSSETKNIVLEVATFDMYAVRKSAMRHGVFTDALTRFNKGQSPLQNDRVMARLLQLIGSLSGAKQASVVYDEGQKDWANQTSVHGDIALAPEFITSRLGVELTNEQIVNLLRRVNFAVEPKEDSAGELSITAPFWRTDIEQPEDIVEEVGRLYGFDTLPRSLPERSTKPVSKNAARELKQKVRESLVRQGANEVLTYSFVHEKTLAAATQDSAQAFKLSNALSPDLQYYRLSVLPSLLEKAQANSRAGYDAFALFEIGKGHAKKALHQADGLPMETSFVDAIYTRKTETGGAAFYYVRRMVEQLGKDHGVRLVFEPAVGAPAVAAYAPFELERSALVKTITGETIGIVGELKQAVLKTVKLPLTTAAFSLELAALETACGEERVSYVPLSRYPSTNRDVSVAVKPACSYDAVYQAAVRATEALAESVKVTPNGVYQAEGGETKNITLHIEITSHAGTLSSNEANAIVARMTDAIIEATGGTIL